MTIYLFCSAGMSTSLLISKMQKEAKLNSLVFQIESFPESSFKEHAEKADVILLGPQIRYKENKIRDEYPHKAVAAIDMRAYGMIDAKAVLETAIELYKEKYS